MRNRIVLLGFSSLLTALSVWFMWPIYGDNYLLITMSAGLALGALIAFAQNRWRLTALTVLILSLLGYLLLALPATNPRALGDASLLLPGWIEAVTGPIFSWKQLLTIELPVGTYHALLAPAFIAYLLIGLLTGRTLFGTISRYWTIAYAFVGVVILAISFGVTTIPGNLNLFGLDLPVPSPIGIGAVILVTLIVFLNWGARVTRSGELIRSAATIRNAGFAGFQRVLRRNLTGFLVLALAIGSTGFFMAQGDLGSTRTVLRSDIVRANTIAKQTSPLSGYRSFFNTQSLFAGNLLSYTTKGAPDRIRIATMPFYDGDSFTVAPTQANQSGDAFFFARVPAGLPATSNGKLKSFSITLNKLDSIWVPLAAGVRKVDFIGSKALAQADALFVNRGTGTGALVPGNSNGAKYAVQYNEVTEPNPATIRPSSSNIDKTLIPENLQTWLDNQSDVATGDATGLLTLAKRIRDSGYLSHSFVKPSGDAASWLDLLDTNAAFYQSAAGHNIARINQMFAEINAKQIAGSPQLAVVSTAGDDEQFATAIALVAAAKGYTARVVIGFRTATAADIKGVPNCDAGSCSGKNLTAWVEVQGDNGEWLTIDATPQSAKKMSTEKVGTKDSKNPTEASSGTAGQLSPPKASPSTDDFCKKHPNDSACIPQCPDVFAQNPMGFLGCKAWPVVANVLEVSLVVGIVVGPFAIIIIMKRNRRRSRRSEDQYAGYRVEGAWDEFIDALVDHGSPMPGNRTRLELADFYSSEPLRELAVLTDIATFSAREVEEVEAEQAWQIVNQRREQFRQSSNVWERLTSLFSLRSFVRQLNTKDQLNRLRSTLNFSQGTNRFEGSKLKAVLVELKRQVLALFSKKKK